jgi:hypothetical protein
MKARNIVVLVLLAAGLAPVSAQTISGTLDSRLSLAAGAGDSPAFFWGFEELANIRLQARLRDRAVFYGAVNLIALAGAQAQTQAQLGAYNQSQGVAGLLPSAFSLGDNYLAALELERLYFRVPGEKTGLDVGLMRIPLGYSLVWGSTDILNPRDPLSTNARPRGVLGTVFSFYPSDDAKITALAAAPGWPLVENGGGVNFGVVSENHWSKASLQGLYSFETPLDAAPGHSASPWGIHRLGLSFKADIEIGVVAEALFTWNPDRDFSTGGLSASAGFDYSLLEGKLYVLLEYLYSGAESSTRTLLRLSGSHYLQGLFRWTIDDYTSLSLSCTASFDDTSFLPALVFDTSVFQGLSLNITAQVPLDRNLFTGEDGDRGSFGPRSMGNYGSVTTTVRLKF